LVRRVRRWQCGWQRVVEEDPDGGDGRGAEQWLCCETEGGEDPLDEVTRRLRAMTREQQGDGGAPPVQVPGHTVIISRMQNHAGTSQFGL
jgi:hypothetical protein